MRGNPTIGCIVAAAFFAMSTVVCAQETLRYCNPLPMPLGTGAQASGDVTVIKEAGKYYMFCTGGGAWVSTDMVHWTWQRVEGQIPVAPHVVKYNGAFYLCGNNGTSNGIAGAEGQVYKADFPLGPYVSLGPWKNTGGVENGWNGAFDVDIFIDDDNKPYLCFPGRSVSGIYVVELNPKDLTEFAGKPKHLFSFDSKHIWERYGEMNEYTDVAWIEGPWMQKHNGTYYLEYSASGTQWKTYAEGYYMGKSPLGPFTYAPNNPLLRKTEGLVTGTAHGSIVEGPDGNLWQFYTIVLSNPPGGRRIGMDRVVFDKDGLMSVKVTDSPQWIKPPAGANAQDSESLPVTINKLRAMNARGSFSSQAIGRDAAYAVDNSSGTWWQPDATDPQPTLTLELSPATRFDPVQIFTIDSCRMMFTGGGGFGGRGRGARGAPAAAPAPPNPASTTQPAVNAHQYRIEASMDGTQYKVVLDQTRNAIASNTIFEVISPTPCRFVRLTLTNWPRAGGPLGIIEFTVFGKATGAGSSEVAIPPARGL